MLFNFDHLHFINFIVHFLFTFFFIMFLITVLQKIDERCYTEQVMTDLIVIITKRQYNITWQGRI